MNESRRCPGCNAEIPTGSPEGLCPVCLLKLGITSAAPTSGTAPFSPHAGFTPPPPESLAAFFPQLEIQELLGQGGMGAVYKARQPGLDRLVALKILPAEVGADPAFAERFTREARALAKLNHPNIVAVYDFGQARDERGHSLFYFLMEYVPGVNLRQAMRQGQMPPAAALKVVPQICDALQFAHDEGIVHRDIKPENILIDKRGRVKIADFGLAKLLGIKTDHLTGTRQVMGTPHYMAPEQIQGTRDVDHRADIYSLGVTFYEMLTGELPLGRFGPPSQKVHIDVRLDEVVLRALEHKPEQRYQHASEIKSEVEGISGVLPAVMLYALGSEYRSRAALFGIPLLHVAFGIDPRTGKKRIARGIVAFGDVAIGAFACGGFAMGGVALGGVAIGLVSLAGMALGLALAIGGMAFGGLAFGGLAVGGVAIGGGAIGWYAAGGGGVGMHGLFGDHQDPAAVAFFESWVDQWPIWLATLGIGLPILSALIYIFIWCVFRFLAPTSTFTGTADRDVSPTDPRRQLVVPGIGLFLAAVLDLFGFLFISVFPFLDDPLRPLLGAWSPPWPTYFLLACQGWACFMLFREAVRMIQTSDQEPTVSLFVAMILPPGIIFGLPFGLWALVVLGRPEVKAAYEQARNETPA